MTKLSTILDHTLGVTCGIRKHHSMLEVGNLILVVEAILRHMMYARSSLSEV